MKSITMSTKKKVTRAGLKKDNTTSPGRILSGSPLKASPNKGIPLNKEASLDKEDPVHLSGASSVETAINKLAAKMDEMQDSLQKVHTDLGNVRSDLEPIKEFRDSLQFTQNELETVKNQISALQDSVKTYTDENAELSHRLFLSERSNETTKERLIQLECYMRRENLKFVGISEDRNESNCMTEKKIRHLLVKQLKVEHGYEIEFQRCHRLGYKSDSKTRDIIVRFLWFQDRECVWANKSELKGTKIIVKEDFPTEVEERRSRLYPVMKAAKANNQKARLVADKLVIDGQRYTIDKLNKLPKQLQHAYLSTKTMDKAVLFYGKDSYLSNFFSAPFVLDGKSFSCPEQYLQYEKAIRASDGEAAGRILNSVDAVEQMRIGRKITVTKEQWDNNIAEQVMEVALKAKFRQNVDLRKKLIETGDRLIVECNANDKLWGCGLRLQDLHAKEKSKWKGQNLLGTILGRIREELK
jgi:ribA/ribD-fused uncharacterized protein